MNVIPLNIKQLIDLHIILSKFTKQSTLHFDESHDHSHMQKVVQNSFEIMENDIDIKNKIKHYPEIINIVSIVAWLHDVRDHKYSESISEDELIIFIKSIDPVNCSQILRVINNISWSKESKGLREHFDAPFDTILDIVSDADRLEALGNIGIERCKTYTEKIGGLIPEDVIEHCYEKLLKILPEGYIKTKHGKKMAKPLHDEIVNYVNSFQLHK